MGRTDVLIISFNSIDEKNAIKKKIPAKDRKIRDNMI